MRTTAVRTKVGVLKEIKDHEARVGMIPSMVRELTGRGHQVMVETQAGLGVDFSDASYQQVGAEIVTADRIFAEADLIIKVKEPQPHECKQLHAGQTLFTFLHLAPDRLQTALLLASGCTAIAYETVTSEQGTLPLLTPMSEVAGRISIQAAAMCLEKIRGGCGMLLGGVPGVPPAQVLVIGGGVVGTQAATMAMGLGAQVTVVDKSLPRLRQLEAQFGSRLRTQYATEDALEHEVQRSHVVVGAVLVPGASAPRLVSASLVSSMQPGSVVVDVAIDQGGCVATSRPTSHSNPTYVHEGVVHYCVSNMPGAVARSATLALNHATMPYILALASQGTKEACLSDPGLRQGVNVHQGQLTHAAVAQAHHWPYVPVEAVL